MNLPKKIKIGCCEYSVNEIEIESDEDYVGRCYPNQQKIEIEKRLSQDKKLQSLFHEIIHAICFEFGNVKLSEQRTDILATGILSVIKDNPKLRRLMWVK